jgi:hypothetical protein
LRLLLQDHVRQGLRRRAELVEHGFVDDNTGPANDLSGSRLYRDAVAEPEC